MHWFICIAIVTYQPSLDKIKCASSEDSDVSLLDQCILCLHIEPEENPAKTGQARQMTRLI